MTRLNFIPTLSGRQENINIIKYFLQKNTTIYVADKDSTYFGSECFTRSRLQACNWCWLPKAPQSLSFLSPTPILYQNRVRMTPTTKYQVTHPDQMSCTRRCFIAKKLESRHQLLDMLLYLQSMLGPKMNFEFDLDLLPDIK